MIQPVDLRPDHLRIVKKILRECLPENVKASVFGSRANGTTRHSSDLDLVLEGDARLDSKCLSALASAFEESDLPYTVDVVDINRIKGRFKEIVAAQKMPLPDIDITD